MVESCILLGILGISSIEDVKTRRIHLFMLYAGAVTGVVCHLIFRTRSIFDLLGGMSIGIAILLLSMVLREQIGIGDGLLLIITGIFLGFSGNLELLLVSLFMMAFWALALLTIGKKNRKTEIPFAPFLLVAYVGMLVV